MTKASTPTINPARLPDTIPEAFVAVSRAAPNQVAMQMKQGDSYVRFTFEDLAKHVQTLSAALSGMGLGPGHRVAIVAENRPEWAMAYLGIVSAGATAVPLDIQMSEEELVAILAESDSRMVFASTRTLPAITKLPPDARLVNLDEPGAPDQIALADLLKAPSPPTEVQISPDDVASLLYTSGTTKKPKGVLLTHGNFVANAKAMMRYGLAGREDNFLVMLPLHHAYPFMIAFLVPLLLGARMTFLQSLKGPDLIQCLRETHITMFVGVPQVFAMIRRAILEQLERRPWAIRVALPAFLALSGMARNLIGWNLGRTLFAPVHQHIGSSLRLLCSGGAKLDAEVARDLTRLGFTIREGYGLTETAPVLAFSPLDRPKSGSVGPSIGNVEIRIVHPDESGVGEVTVRGPNVMKGYDRNPEATAEAIRDGWFHTGDMGYVDSDGYLYLTGRLKELIVTAGGKNIVPEEVEILYEQSPAIKEVCLIGTKREGEEGECLHAVVVPDFEYLKGQKIPEASGHIRRVLTKVAITLPTYKRIMGVTIVKEPLPRTRLGKIQRHRVKAIVQAGVPQHVQRPALSEADRAVLETTTARRVFSALARLLPAGREIHLEDHLDLDLGLDSLKRLELMATLENQFGALPEDLAADALTVRDLVEKLQERKEKGEGEGEAQRPWREIIEMPPPPNMTETLFAHPSMGDRIATRLGLVCLKALFRVGFRLSARGQEHIPIQGPCVLASNHLSFLDPFLILAAIPRLVVPQMFALGWGPYFRGAFRQWVARIGHVIPVGPETPLVAVLRTSAAVLKQGKYLLVFPEGERSVEGRLLPFKKGVGVLACELSVPVIPVKIEGSFEAWPPESRLPRFGRITLHFGKPLTVSPQMITDWSANGLDPHETAASLIRDAVVALSQLD